MIAQSQKATNTTKKTKERILNFKQLNKKTSFSYNLLLVD